MKLWWTNVVKDYLAFSKKERRGIFTTIFLCVFIYIFSRYFPVAPPPYDKSAFAAELAKLKISIDSGNHSYPYRTRTIYSRTAANRREAATEPQLFTFDPNTLDARGWKRLGLRERTIQTLQHFMAKGFKFRQATDLHRIYGLQPAEAERLIPFVRIAEKEVLGSASENHKAERRKPDADSYKTRIIDINEADTSAFISLPGIGTKLAARIVNFRQKLGGFFSVEQLGETYGIPDSTFQMIRQRLRCANPAVTKININTASPGDLKRHPYINWNIANAIVNYRAQHGNYSSVDDLHKIEIVTDDLFKKIAPYLEV